MMIRMSRYSGSVQRQTVDTDMPHMLLLLLLLHSPTRQKMHALSYSLFVYMSCSSSPRRRPPPPLVCSLLSLCTTIQCKVILSNWHKAQRAREKQLFQFFLLALFSMHVTVCVILSLLRDMNHVRRLFPKRPVFS
jgi:hypothetical protein